MLLEILYNLFLIPSLFSLFLLNPIKNSYYQKANIAIDKKQFVVYLADTPYKHSKGLMFAKKLNKNEGMLFVFNSSSRPTFYNKNVKMPLGFVWINSSNQIVDYTELPKNTFKTTQSSSPILYALEVNQGIFDTNIIGSKVSIQEN